MSARNEAERAAAMRAWGEAMYAEQVARMAYVNDPDHTHRDRNFTVWQQARQETGIQENAVYALIGVPDVASPTPYAARSGPLHQREEGK